MGEVVKNMLIQDGLSPLMDEDDEMAEGDTLENHLIIITVCYNK